MVSNKSQKLILERTIVRLHLDWHEARAALASIEDSNLYTEAKNHLSAIEAEIDRVERALDALCPPFNYYPRDNGGSVVSTFPV